MNDDTFTLLCSIGAFGVCLMAGFALAVLCFDAQGHWRWRR